MKTYNTLCWTCVHTNEVDCPRFESPMRTPVYAKLSKAGNVVECSRHTRLGCDNRYTLATVRGLAAKYGVSVRTAHRRVLELLYCECLSFKIVEYAGRMYRINCKDVLVSEGEDGKQSHGSFKNRDYVKQLCMKAD